VQKIHYSLQDEAKRAGAHSKTIRVREFIDFVQPLADNPINVMLEVKDKNLSAVKCALCLDTNGHIQKLEKQWSLYKYLVLEKNPAGYTAIRELLKDKSAYPAIKFFDIIEASLGMDENKGFAINAAQHVWGYFKKVCTAKEKAIFEKLLEDYGAGHVAFQRIKNFLFRLSTQYQMAYLLDSYFFIG
jgi:UV DNA damage endonuclease